jgi:hypothetical protein
VVRCIMFEYVSRPQSLKKVKIKPGRPKGRQKLEVVMSKNGIGWEIVEEEPWGRQLGRVVAPPFIFISAPVASTPTVTTPMFFLLHLWSLRWLHLHLLYFRLLHLRLPHLQLLRLISSHQPPNIIPKRPRRKMSVCAEMSIVIFCRPYSALLLATAAAVPLALSKLLSRRALIH